MFLTALHCINKSLYFVEIALGIDLIVWKCRRKVIASIEIFDGLFAGTDFLDGDAEDSG